VTINGKPVTDADQREMPDMAKKPKDVPAPKDKPLKGYVSVQSHGPSAAEYRAVRVREIKQPDGKE